MNTSLFDEMRAAGRGVLALLSGDKRAGGFFDFSQRGLAGSFIAVLIVTGLNGLPVLVGADVSGIGRAILLAAILFAVQIGFAAIVLRQLKRMDGFVPYLVAYNWATFFVSLVSLVLSFAGFGAEAALLVVGLVMLVMQINIARLIVTLTPLQIAMFIIAQMVGVLIGLVAISLVFPLPAEVAAQLGV